jgi:hypothetical protein
MKNNKQPVHFTIKEKSFIARIAAWKLHAQSIAIVFGRTIHLHNTTSQEFLQNESWLKHELCHVKQFNEHGFFPFILKYLVESIRHGYHNNKYEIDARQAEKEEAFL